MPGLTKTAALRGSARDVNADERIAVGLELAAAPVSGTLRILYPGLFPLHDPSGEWGKQGPKGG